MTVLITRPIDDARILANELRECGIASFIEPMFHVKHLFFRFTVDKFQKLQGLILTSRHAVVPIKELELLPCFVIGSATAKKAQECGFKNIVLAKGNLNNLLDNILTHYIPDKGSFLYLRGSLVTRDIVEFLKGKDIDVVEEVIYQTTEIRNLSPSLFDKFLAQEIKTSVFFSKNTVTIFNEKLRDSNLLSLYNQISCFAISGKVADALKHAGFERIQIFEDNKDLIRLLQEYYKDEKN